jgi:signal transduction histidine kinase
VTNGTIDHETLLQFLYQCPVGIAQIDCRGVILLLNAVGSQLLMPYARRSEIDNLFVILEPHDPELRSLVLTSRHYGKLCEHRVVRLESPDPRRPGDRHLALTLLKIGPEMIMAVFEDVTRVVDAETEARSLLTSEALERGRSEMAAEVLHDIGNAIVGLGTRTVSLLKELEWPELLQISKLNAFLAARDEALIAALGPTKAVAVRELLGEVVGALEARRQRFAASVQSSTASIHHIQEILNLHRHYARHAGTGVRERVSLIGIAQDALTIQAASLEKREVIVERRMDPDLPRLSIDRTRMIQVLVNLLKNSCEAFDARPINAERRIAIAAARAADGEHATLTLCDNGCGFATDRAESFFEKHQSTKHRGSGIGLYHCRRVVEAHGGTLRLESDGPGRGARAIVTLPLPPTPEPSHVR